MVPSSPVTQCGCLCGSAFGMLTKTSSEWNDISLPGTSGAGGAGRALGGVVLDGLKVIGVGGISGR